MRGRYIRAAALALSIGCGARTGLEDRILVEDASVRRGLAVCSDTFFCPDQSTPPITCTSPPFVLRLSLCSSFMLGQNTLYVNGVVPSAEVDLSISGSFCGSSDRAVVLRNGIPATLYGAENIIGLSNVRDTEVYLSVWKDRCAPVVACSNSPASCSGPFQSNIVPFVHDGSNGSTFNLDNTHITIEANHCSSISTSASFTIYGPVASHSQNIRLNEGECQWVGCVGVGLSSVSANANCGTLAYLTIHTRAQ